MLHKRHAFYLVLVTALAGVVAALPASAHAHHGGIPCMGAPDFVGHMGDADGSFHYPAGRSAEHVNAGTFTLAIDDTSNTQNFRLRDLTCLTVTVPRLRLEYPPLAAIQWCCRR